jgi:olefin beta-lactone synthetase
VGRARAAFKRAGERRIADNGRMSEPCNIAARLPTLARERGDQVALRCPGTRGPDGLARYDIALTYAELDARSDAIAAGLSRRGIVRGTRTVVMVRPTPEFFLLMFALFKAGAVPVLVDPGIDKRALRQCLDEAEPAAFVGIPLAHVGRVLLGWAKSARVRITTGARAWLADATLAQVERAGAGAGPQLAATEPDEIAAIVFTSGSTGVPKGVVYRHRHFVAQIELLRTAFGIEAGGVDFPTFPPFALFDPALGLTSVIPDMDPTRPAQADPRRLHAAIARFGADQLFGSPALMRVLADHGQPLPTLRRVTSAGAPVPPDVVARMRALLPEHARFWTPYGATECLPVAVIEGRELEATREATERGAGTCVGRPVPPNEVRIIAITDAAIERWEDARVLPAGEVGEITVAGPSATDLYFRREAQTRLAASASCTAWATSAGSTPRAGCGSAGANRIASKPPTVRCSPNRSSRCSTPTRTSRAPRWWASAPSARRRRCCAWSWPRACPRAPGRASSANCAHSARASRTPPASRASCATRSSRSTSATTPRSAARRWRCGRRGGWGERSVVGECAGTPGCPTRGSVVLPCHPSQPSPARKGRAFLLPCGCESARAATSPPTKRCRRRWQTTTRYTRFVRRPARPLPTLPCTQGRAFLLPCGCESARAATSPPTEPEAPRASHHAIHQIRASAC